MEKRKCNFKASPIHTFKNDFITIFTAISFQFSAISGIQTDPKGNFTLFKIELQLL